MSFIVKGFDIPKDAVFFKLSFYNEDNNNEYGVRGSLKPYIIQIPKKHGRLIDAKLLADTINKAIQDGTFISKSIWEWIADAPTVLEAEE